MDKTGRPVGDPDLEPGPQMTASYTTTGGEMIDEIAARHYGHQLGTAEAVMDANPGLAALAPILPPGLTIILPDLAAPAATNTPVKLYD